MQCVWAIVSSVACPALQCFSALSHKSHAFRKKKLLNIKCVILFSLGLSETSVILRSTERIGSRMYISLYVSTSYSCPILIKLQFSRQILEKTFIYQISLKSVQWEPSCFTRTDRMNLIVAFRIFRMRQ